MRLNTISPNKAAKQASKRVGRGSSSGLGKTSGRGNKGQRARSGGRPQVGFEGGQMPLKRRLPKIGFVPRIQRGTAAEVRLHELAKVKEPKVDLEALKRANLVSRSTKRAKVVLKGKIDAALTVQGLAITRGARAAIEKAGGKVLN